MPMQAIWEKEGTFQEDAPTEPDGRGKFFVTFPYPYSELISL